MNEVFSLSPFDFHVHTGHSHDGEGSIMEYCELAARNNMAIIGFCDHLDLDPNDPVSGQHDYDRYRTEIDEARSRFQDRLAIRMGIEVGYVPRVEAEIAEYLAAHAYDYAVGSVHSINDGFSGVSEEYDAAETFARHEVMEVFHEYFEVVNRMVVTGLFDVVGHMDLVNRFGTNYLSEPLEWGRFYGVLRNVFEGVIKRQMALEINTSGLFQAPQATYPPREALRLYREIGGEHVIIGSDTHRLENLAAGVPAAVKLAQDLGLCGFMDFENRIPRQISV